MAQSIDTPLPFVTNLSIVDDPELGRCFTSQQAYHVGEVLFTEKALVWASFAEGERLDKRVRNLYEKAYPKAVTKNIDQLLDELSGLQCIQSFDTAKNLLQLIALTVLRHRNETAAISNFVGSARDLETSLKLHYFDKLTAVNLENCISDITAFRVAYPKVIPKSVTNAEAGRLLAVLNTNQLELEELGGAGLFVGTAVTEHSCYPNSSFSTHGHTLYMTCIRDISVGERISIDYGNNYYQSTAERVGSLLESYRFTCKCPMCLGPDLKRAFVCNKCPTGAIFPIGVGMNQEGDCLFSTCETCGSPPDLNYRKLCIQKEEECESGPPTSLEEIVNITSVQRVLLESHHLIFWASDDLAMRLATKARSQGATLNETANSSKGVVDAANKSNLYYREALVAMNHTVRLLEVMLPPVHQEKVLYYDRLGQLAVAAGELEIASVNFQKAYEMSCFACGENHPSTLQIKELLLQSPNNLTDLMLHYSQSGYHKDQHIDMEEG